MKYIFFVFIVQAIELAFKAANLQPSDIVYDLGCGDGRVLIYAAKTVGCKCIGYEYDKVFYDRAIRNIKNENLEELIVFFSLFKYISNRMFIINHHWMQI